MQALIPEGFTVDSIWCHYQQKFVGNVKYSTVKNTYLDNNKTKLYYDEVYFPYELQPNQIGYIKFKKSESDKPAPKVEAPKAHIKADSYGCEFVNDAKNPTVLNFKLHDKETNDTHALEFELREYLAFQGGNSPVDSGGSMEGAYEFKPTDDHLMSLPYLQNTKRSYTVQPMDGDIQAVRYEFVFEDNNSKNPQTAVVKVTCAPKYSDFAEFRVELNGISVMEDHQGKDVTVNFRAPHIDGKGQFWTDSNGLEMQERHINERPDFKFTLQNNISSNFYPVTTGIAIQGEDLQLTVLNDKSQAGSAEIIPGRVELIHNRRLITDDNKGVIEPLNETDSQGYGIKVDTQYYVRINKIKESHSFQRK
jgi:hypothetical protein